MASAPKLYISLLVHEQPEVILDQLRNFKRFAPGAVLILHLSQGFAPPPDFFEKARLLGGVHFNPVSVPTNKVNLLCPHLENLQFLESLGPDAEDYVAFHASNDLLVREGLMGYLQNFTAGYFKDGILDPKRDADGAAKIALDESFTRLRERFGVKTVIWSQVEGCFFKVRHLRIAQSWIREAGMDMRVKRAYFAEEVILPTIVHKLIAEEGGAPVAPCYMLSEVSFLVKYVELRRKLFGYTFIALVFGRIIKVLGPRKITRRLVDGIRKGDLGFYAFFGRSNGNLRFEAKTVFGVKRVERKYDDLLRIHIRKLVVR